MARLYLVALAHFAAGDACPPRRLKNVHGNFLFVLQRAFPDPAVRRLILGENIARLLALDAAGTA